MVDERTPEHPLIELESLSMAYGRVTVFARLSLSIQPGEYVTICGPSGSGKTTLLALIGLLEAPTSGAYRLDGRDMSAIDDSHLSRLRNTTFGFVFQQSSLIPELTAWQNVARPLSHAGVGRRERKLRALRLLERFGLAAKAEHRPAQLSGGEQQRVAIARALVNDPQVVLADEPTANLPPEQWRPILEDLERLHEEGRTVLVVTHNAEVAARAGRTLWLADGALQDRSQASAPVVPQPSLEAEPRLTLSFLGTATAERSGEEVRVQPRQAEILALLASNPQGLTGEQLLLELYGDTGRADTVKAAISRLRRQVAIASQPYRIDEPYRADFLEALEALKAGNLHAALERYQGPLLPASEAPGVVGLRDDLDRSLRLAVLGSHDAELLFRLAERLRDDLELWEAACAALDMADPRCAVAQANAERVRADWGA